MVLIVSQLDLQALSKFNYCHIYFDSPLRIYCSIIKYKVDLQKYFNLWSGLLKIAI